MGKLPHLSSKKVLQKLKAAGFIETHQRGSHLYLKNAEKIVTLPVHGTKDIPAGTLYNIIVRQAGMTIDDFLEL
ncbi:MAG: type II toxin-antitoxin system HicA family toxin [Candidatus Paceibacterota bacterium]|jgi:predicted RNA binding protein YcfA (HicA-like mRNA interferase family)